MGGKWGKVSARLASKARCCAAALQYPTQYLSKRDRASTHLSARVESFGLFDDGEPSPVSSKRSEGQPRRGRGWQRFRKVNAHAEGLLDFVVLLAVAAAGDERIER